jgi:hypothetical protein
MENLKLWFKAAGLTNLGWGAGFVAAGLAGWSFIAGGCAGIFIYVNFNVIKKLIKGDN